MKVLISFSFILSALCGLAQISVSDVLSKPLTNDELAQVLAKEDFLENHKFNSPWLRDLDFRARSNDREVGLEDYRLRFTLLNPKEIAANKDYRKLIVSQQAFERKKTINDVLFNRYEIIIEANYVKETLSFKKQQLESLMTYKKMLIGDSFEFSDIIKMEHEITKAELAIGVTKQRLDVLEEVFRNKGFSSLVDFNDFNWIQGLQIQNILNISREDSNSINQVSKLQKLEQEESIMKIKKAEAFSNIGFVQAEYDTERGNSLDDHMGFQLGITIPILNINKPDLQRRELEIIEKTMAYNESVSEESESIDRSSLVVKNLIDQHKIIMSKKSDLAEIEKIIQESDPDLTNYIRFSEYHNYLKEKDLSYQSDILIRYIKLLHQQGALSDQPYLNYLSSDLTSIDLK